MLTGDERVGRIRIESDSSSSEYEEEEEQIGIPNCNAEDCDEDEQMIPEGMLPVYRTDNYEWNHYEKPKGNVCEFRGDSSYLSSFLYSLFKRTETMLISKHFCQLPKIMLANLPLQQQKYLTIPLRMRMTVVRLSRRRMTFI